MMMALLMATANTLSAQTDDANTAQHRHQDDTQITDSLTSGRTVETRTYNNMLSRTTVTEVKGDSTYQSSTLNINLPLFPTPSRSNSYDNGFNWEWNWGGPTYEEHYTDIYFSFAFAGDKNIPLNSVSSWEWGMYPLSGTLLHSRNYRTLLTWGFGFSRTSYRLKDQAPQGSNPGFVNQRFRYWSWRLPVSLEFQSANHRSFAAIGLEAELRHHVRARQYGDALSKPDYIVVGHDKDLVNPWACNLLLQAGTSDAGIVARVALTELFDKNLTPLKAAPFSIGLSLGF